MVGLLETNIGSGRIAVEQSIESSIHADHEEVLMWCHSRVSIDVFMFDVDGRMTGGEDLSSNTLGRDQVSNETSITNVI